MQKALFALALLFLVVHVAWLPSTLADIDEINFALGVRDFDVARHQPHPPGYPVFMAGGKAVAAGLAAVGVTAPEVRALALISAVAGALLIPLLFLLYRQLSDDPRIAAWAAVVSGLSPLIAFNALRPLSDLAGLATVVAAQGLIAASMLTGDSGARSRRLMLGALVAGVAIGIRSQSFFLTVPIFAVAVALPGTGVHLRHRALAVVALGIGVLAWAVPLLVASGGPQAYLEALRNQAGEDLTGVVMVWTARSARVAVDAVENTFLWPWGALPAGWIVVAIGAAGGARLIWRAPAAAAVLAVAFAPYAVFHLLFQETATTRYAMPLVVPVAFLFVYALRAVGPTAAYAGCAVLTAWSLFLWLPSMQRFGSRPTPAARAVADAIAASAPDGLVGMHAVMLRPEQWYHDNASGRVQRRLHGREVPALVELWRQEPGRVVTFIADPRRSDLAMLDPRTREPIRLYDWGFREMPLLGGVRPGEVSLFTLRPPGWMVDQGWALTAEIGGQTERQGAGPHRAPAVVWIRSRDEGATMLIGGRNLGAQGTAAARVAVSLRGRELASFGVPPGFFFETRTLPPSLFSAAEPYLPLQVSAAGSAPIRVGLEQFDLQSGDVPMVGMAAGWYEPEYAPVTGLAWRWMSDHATLWVRSVGRDLTLRLRAESPLRYFDAPPVVRVRAADRVLAQFSPSSDFTQEVTIPADALRRANDLVTIESDKWFFPSNGDPRRLALRVYAVEIN